MLFRCYWVHCTRWKLKKIIFKNLIFNPHTIFAYNLIFLYILTLKYIFLFVFNAVFCTRRVSVPVAYVRTTLLMVSILWGGGGSAWAAIFFFFFTSFCTLTSLCCHSHNFLSN